MSYGTPLSITLPTIDGVATEAQAATRINDCFNAIKARLEQKIGPASIDMNADLSFLSGANYFGAKDLQRVSWTSLSAALAAGTYPYTAYVVDGNWYFNDGAGNQIQITSAGAVNVSAVGGVTGAGYGTGGVEVNWDSVNTRYRMRSGAAADSFAAVECDDVILRDASGNAIRVASPALGADYTLTLPSAVAAAAGSLVLMDTAGALTTSRAPTLASVTLDAAGHFTVSSTGRYKHGTLTKLIPAASAIGGGSAGFVQAQGLWDIGIASDTVAYPIDLDAGKRVLTARLHSNFTTADTKSLSIYRLSSAGVTTIVETINSTSATGWASRTFNFADVTVATGNTYYLLFAAGHATDQVGGIELDYDHP